MADSHARAEGPGHLMSPDTTTAPAPVQAPVDVPVETPSRPVTDDGDHDRFAHYAAQGRRGARLRDR